MQSTPRATTPVTIRLAERGDAAALAHLAGRDTRRVPRAPIAVAERGGLIVAAVSLGDGSAIADPFAPTAAVVEMVRAWGHDLQTGPSPRPPRRRRRRAALRPLALGRA